MGARFDEWLAHTKIFGASVFVNLNDVSANDMENTRIRLIVEALLRPTEAIPIAAQNTRVRRRRAYAGAWARTSTSSR